jgi:hypothetical protein
VNSFYLSQYHQPCPPVRQSFLLRQRKRPVFFFFFFFFFCLLLRIFPVGCTLAADSDCVSPLESPDLVSEYRTAPISTRRAYDSSPCFLFGSNQQWPKFAPSSRISSTSFYQLLINKKASLARLRKPRNKPRLAPTRQTASPVPWMRKTATVLNRASFCQAAEIIQKSSTS